MNAEGIHGHAHTNTDTHTPKYIRRRETHINMCVNL